jgi:hypothetical protein
MPLITGTTSIVGEPIADVGSPEPDEAADLVIREPVLGYEPAHVANSDVEPHGHPGNVEELFVTAGNAVRHRVLPVGRWAPSKFVAR